MRDLVKRIAGFFSGKYSERTINKKIVGHIGNYCSRKRINASIIEINIVTVPMEHVDFISIEVICDCPGKLIGIGGRTSAELSAELSLLIDSRIELNVKRFEN